LKARSAGWAARAMLLALLAAALVLGYRFVIFLVTFYAT
jgi:hypothetical protein